MEISNEWVKSIQPEGKFNFVLLLKFIKPFEIREIIRILINLAHPLHN